MPGKDAFDRVPDFARNDRDAVERVPTGRHFGARNLAAAELGGSGVPQLPHDMHDGLELYSLD